MQPRTLQQILAESANVYDPQVASVQGQIDALPGQTAAEEQGLQAKQTQAFGDILNGARRRGLGFSGIPIGEQAQYTATNYLPALAQLHTAQQQRATSLQDAILGIRERQNQFAQGVYQTEQDRAEQARQFDAAQAAQRAQAASYAGLFNKPQTPQAPVGGAQISQRTDKGFNFTNQFGNPISAAQYAALKGIPFRDLLGVMAQQGDAGAKAALGFVGNDFGYDRSKVKTQDMANLYNGLVWGTNAPQASIPTAGYSSVNGMRVPNF